MHRAPVLSAVIITLLAPAAFAASDCKLAYIEPPLGATVTWTGPCKDGYADGHGVLDIMRGKTVVLHYKGDIREGQLHGKGYLQRMDNDSYEGAFENDNPHGFGIGKTRSGTYEGEWRNGRREGKGKMTFVLGGQYDGEWKNNRFHGTGTARYISGREVTAQFVNGVRADLPALVKSDARHAMRSDPVLGTHIRELAIRNGAVPFTKSYAAMSAADRATVRSWFPLLDDKDEPPYPLYGSAALYKAILEYTQFSDVRGTVHMVVDVDEKGIATGATVQATPNDDLASIIKYIAMTQPYSPGRCAGQPCPMKFPLSISVGAGLGSTDDVR